MTKQTEIARLRAALNLALSYLEINEPSDSRAVSDEFVAMAAVAHDGGNPECMSIILNALNARKSQP